MTKTVLLVSVFLSCATYAQERNVFIFDFYQQPLTAEQGKNFKSQASTVNLPTIGHFFDTYTPETTGNTSTDILLVSPLSGHWQITGASIKLNSIFACQINP